MFAMTPPGRTTLVQMSKVSGVPTACVGQRRDLLLSVGSGWIDRHVGAEAERVLAPRLSGFQRDDAGRAGQRSGLDRGQADRSRADDYDHVARLDPAVLDSHLVAGRQDIGQEQHLFVGHAVGHLVHARFRERHPRVLGLSAVDQVAEDPSDAAGRLAVARHRALAVGTPPAGCDRRDEHPVALSEAGHRRAHRCDGADRLVAEDAAVGDSGHISFEDVQVSAADRGGVHLDDDVGGLGRTRVRDGVPGLLARAVIHECLQWDLPDRDNQRDACLEADPNSASERFLTHCETTVTH
jgi:hypothetical protein